jgi:hypothetical protein
VKEEAESVPARCGPEMMPAGFVGFETSMFAKVVFS